MTPVPARPVCFGMRTVWIGTSGWVYKEWAGNFYPKGWPKKDEFRYYARHFPTVEINATFYRLPTKKMVRGWRDKSPDGFVFAVKGSRYLTHIRRLNDTSKGLQKYFRRIVPLGHDRTGPILWQLPPNFGKTPENARRLERFLSRLPKPYRHAVEFRHPSWMDAETHTLLRRHGAANVWISSLRMPADYTVTADFVYLRFHGLKDGAYHDYTDDELDPWAKQLARAARRGIPSYVYFNNDLNTRAPLNAIALMKMLGRHAVPALAADPADRPPEIAPPIKGAETWRPWSRPQAKAVSIGTRKRPPAARTRKTDPKPRSKSTRRAAAGTVGGSRKTQSSRAKRSAMRTTGRTPAVRVSRRPARSRRWPRVIPPAQPGVRRFAAAQFSSSALPPAR